MFFRELYAAIDCADAFLHIDTSSVSHPHNRRTQCRTSNPYPITNEKVGVENGDYGLVSWNKTKLVSDAIPHADLISKAC